MNPQMLAFFQQVLGGLGNFGQGLGAGLGQAFGLPVGTPPVAPLSQLAQLGGPGGGQGITQGGLGSAGAAALGDPSVIEAAGVDVLPPTTSAGLQADVAAQEQVAGGGMDWVGLARMLSGPGGQALPPPTRPRPQLPFTPQQPRFSLSSQGFLTLTPFGGGR